MAPHKNEENSVAKIGLFFGSDEGNTENIAGRIAQRLGPDNVDIYDTNEMKFNLSFSFVSSLDKALTGLHNHLQVRQDLYQKLLSL